jgi:hypothetical protein
MSIDTLAAISKEEKIDPKQFGEYAQERQQLKSIFDPLAEEAADKIHDLVVRHPSEVKELARKFETVELPYGEAYVMMSPLILGDRTDMQPPVDWEGSKMDWYDKLINDFVERIENEGTEYEKTRYGDLKERLEWSDFNNRPPDDIPYNSYYFFTELKRSFVPEKWKTYKDSYEHLKQEGREQEFYEMAAMRRRNGHNRYSHFTDAEYDSFLYAHAELSKPSMFENVIVPVGEYGEEYAKKLAQATIITMEAAEVAIKDNAGRVAAVHSKLLQEHTARGAEEEDGPNAYSTALTIQEGVLSIMQTVSLLTAEKVEGYDDPTKLLNDIVENGLIEKVTRLVPPALVGPLALDGRRFANPLERDEDGKLQLTEIFEGKLKAAHIKYWQDVIEEKKSSKSGQHPKIGTGLTCPASGKGVGVLAAALNEVFQVTV